MAKENPLAVKLRKAREDLAAATDAVAAAENEIREEVRRRRAEEDEELRTLGINPVPTTGRASKKAPSTTTKSLSCRICREAGENRTDHNSRRHDAVMAEEGRVAPEPKQRKKSEAAAV